MLARVARDLKNPLTALKLQLERIKRGHGGERCLHAAMRQVDRLALLTDNVIGLACIAAGDPGLRPTEVDLAALVRELVDRAALDGIRIDLLTQAPVAGRWDRVRLEQVIDNLLSNAVKYGEGKPVTVTVWADGEWVRLRVRDRGGGVAAEGLWMVRRLAESIGGRLSVERASDPGTSVTVLLPAVRDGIAGHLPV
jgi:signal transduction histidine kinase